MQVIMFKFDNLAAILVAVEEMFGPNASAAKRQEAIDMINADVDIALMPEWMEAKIIGVLVDLAVQGFNWIWGHDWLVAVKALIAKHKGA